MKNILKGGPIGPLNAPDYPYGPGGPRIDDDPVIKIPPNSIPDYPYGPGGPGAADKESDND